MNQEILEEKLAELPLYCYQFFDPQELEILPARPVDLRARMPHVRQKLGVPSRRRQRGDMSRRSVCATKTA